MDAMRVAAPQIVFNIIVLSLIAKWYIAPRLAQLPRDRALVPLLLVHLIRPISLWTLVPGVIVSPNIPLEWSWSTAIGDAIAAVLALTSIMLLRRRAAAAIAVVWVFNALGFLDVLKNGVMAARLGVLPHMGAGALVPAYAVPVLLVSHGLMFWLLLRRSTQAA